MKIPEVATRIREIAEQIHGHCPTESTELYEADLGSHNFSHNMATPGLGMQPVAFPSPFAKHGGVHHTVRAQGTLMAAKSGDGVLSIHSIGLPAAAIRP